MAHINASLVRETTATTSTGTYSLAGAQTNFRDFDSVMADGDTCWYCARLGSDFEIGLGTFTSGSPDTLARTQVFESSNSNNAVNWGAGTKDIYMTTVPEALAPLQTNISTPQGRLTLTTAVPVLTSTVSGATTVYYTPYLGRMVPLYNGAYWKTHDIGGELSQATTDNTKSPAAVANNSNYDVFVWKDGATYRATRGPAWSSDTSRGTGAGTTELERVNGILVNKQAITNGPAAQRGTYVGTIRSNGSAAIDWIYGVTGDTPTAAKFMVWNMYNRTNVSTIFGDSTNSWTYGTNTWRSANASTNMRVSFVTGLKEDDFSFAYNQMIFGDGTNFGNIGLGVDVTNAASGIVPQGSSLNTLALSVVAQFEGSFLGSHFVQAIEIASGGSIIYFGDNNLSGKTQSGIVARLRM